MQKTTFELINISKIGIRFVDSDWKFRAAKDTSAFQDNTHDVNYDANNDLGRFETWAV